jgi:hypothetical protein
MISSANLRAFWKAVGVGTLAGAWLPLTFTTLIVLSSLPDGPDGRGDILVSIWLAVSPLAITFPIVLSASVLIGLPVVAVLRANGSENVPAYALLGGLAGLLVCIALVIVLGSPLDTHWIGLLGAFSGAVTGRSWGKDRERMIEGDCYYPAP